jgi:hypothetical protein
MTRQFVTISSEAQTNLAQLTDTARTPFGGGVEGRARRALPVRNRQRSGQPIFLRCWVYFDHG